MVPGLSNREMTTRLVHVVDSAKNEYQIPTAPQSNHMVGSLLTFGCIANVGVPEESIGVADPPGVEDAFALGAAVAGPPSTSASATATPAARTHRRAWEEVLWPLTGAFGVLSRERVPVGGVDDHHLERGRLAGYRLLARA